MSDDNQNLSDAEKPKKRRSPQRRSPVKTRHPGTMSAEELNTSLSSIYQDDSGSIPDMKTMSVRKNASFLATLARLVVFIGIASALAFVGYSKISSKNPATDNTVQLTVTGPTEHTLGALNTYTISYKNNGPVPLNKVAFTLYYPKGFVFTTSSPALKNAAHTELTLPSIAPGASGVLTISGRNYGVVNEQKSWRVFMNYTPSDFNSELQKAATLTTKLAASSVVVAITGADKAVVGAESVFAVAVGYDKDFSLPFELVPVLPPNFVITSSTPALGKNNVWNITPATTSSPAALQFALRGKFTAPNETPSALKMLVLLPLGGERLEIARAEILPELIKNELDFSLVVNGSLNDFSSTLGDILVMTLHLKNTSADIIKNATVNLVLDGPSFKRQSILQWSEITDAADGDIQGVQTDDVTRRGTIIWNNKKIPALAKIKPNDEITIDLRLPIKDAKTFDPATIKNPIIVAAANLAFTNSLGATATVLAKPITITLNSDLKLDSRETIEKNAEGQEIHSVAWVLTNNVHPLKNITLSATAYGDIAIATSTASAGTLSLDSAAKQIVWKIAEMPESLDVANAGFSITLRKNNPTQNTLLSKAHLTAEDSVTGQKIDLAGEEITLNGSSPTP